MEACHKLGEAKCADKFAKELMPLSTHIADLCNIVEEAVPEDMWPVPKYYDMLFIR
jgi:glutamine synthetase